METTQHKITRTAARFLTSGQTGKLSDDELGAACDQIIQKTAQKSITIALNKARIFNKRASSRKGILPSISWRTLARMLHINSRHEEAEKAYIIARRLNQDILLRARIDRALIDVYMYLGDYKKAAMRAKKAIKTFESDNLPAEMAMTNVNYANLLHRQDRHREAEAFYLRAELYFREQGNDLAVARCAYNRGNTLVQLFDMDLAEKLFAESLEIYSQNNYDLDANDASYGLAWLHMLQGKFHQALNELTLCEQKYRECGQWRGVNLCALDRAEVYLSLNLMEETRILARKSQRWFATRGFGYEESKAALFRAIAAKGIGADREFDTSIEKAIFGFKKCKNDGFLGVAKFFKADTYQENKNNSKELKNARKIFDRAQLPLWQAYCDLALVSSGDTGSEKSLKNNPAVEWVPHLYAQWNVMLGDNHAEAGNKKKAREHWKKAADRLDAMKAGLPPLELRSGYARTASDPHGRLIRAEIQNDPEKAGAWLERFKMSGMWAPLIGNYHEANSKRESLEQSLHELSMQISAIANGTAINRNQRWNIPSGLGEKFTRKTQRIIREKLSMLEDFSSPDPDDISFLTNQIRKISSDLPVAQFYVDGEDLFCIVHHNGSSRVTRWDNGRLRIESLLRKWRFILERSIQQNHESLNGSINQEQKLFSEIGSFLWEPLEIPHASEKVLIIPDGDMANLPWQAVIGNGTPLIESHSVVISPSIRHYLKANRQPSPSNEIRVFVGKADDLSHVSREIEAFSAVPNQSLKVRRPATRDDWPMAGSARVWHYAGHANYNASNPFYSYLEMNDGHFFAVDFRLRKVDVHLTTLASCRSGEQLRMPGEESIGFVRSLLEMGSQNVIAAHWPVSDTATAKWITAFYHNYLNNKSISESFRSASLQVRERFPSAYHWAAFSLFGAGN